LSTPSCPDTLHPVAITSPARAELDGSVWVRLGPGFHYAHCCCWHSLLYASLFYPEVCVPKDYIAATVDLRKKRKSLKGMAGRKRLSIMKAMVCDEKEVASKVRYMRPTAAADAGMVLPPVVFPSDDDDFEVNAH
jgi:hypothetical protein